MISYRYLIRAVEQYSLRSNQILLTTEILFYFLNQPNGPNANKCGTKSDFKRTSINVWSRLEASDTEPIYVIALQTGTNLPIHKRSINIFYKRTNSLVVCKLINKKTYFLKIFKKFDAFNNGLVSVSYNLLLLFCQRYQVKLTKITELPGQQKNVLTIYTRRPNPNN